MNEPITPEQSEKLLQAIFAEEDTDEDNYPETISEKVGYAEYVLTHNLSNIGKALNRLSRLSRLLLASEKHENGLPDIITNNELRMALKPLLIVREDVAEITDILKQVYRETKQPKEEHMKKHCHTCRHCQRGCFCPSRWYCMIGEQAREVRADGSCEEWETREKILERK